MSMRTRRKLHKSIYPRWMAKQDAPPRLAKERDGNRCISCGVADRTLITDEQGQPRYILYLHAAHLCPLDPMFAEVEPIDGQHMRAMCPRCHRLYDLYWEAREEEVEHQRRMHGILLEGWLGRRFLEVL